MGFFLLVLRKEDEMIFKAWQLLSYSCITMNPGGRKMVSSCLPMALLGGLLWMSKYGGLADR